MKFLPLIIVLCTTPFLLFSQNSPNPEIDIKSITILGIDFNDKLGKIVLNDFKDAYVANDDNEILLKENIIKSNLSHNQFLKLSTEEKENKLQYFFNKKRVGQQLLSYWFNRQNDNSFNTEIFKKNGFSELNPENILNQVNSKKGRKELLKNGLNVVNDSYLLVFDFEEIKTMSQSYTESNTNIEDQILNGFIADVSCYLVHLDFNEETVAHFFKNHWMDNNSNKDSSTKIKAFDNSEFPFVLRNKYSFKITSTQHNEGQALANRVQRSDEELLQSMTELSIQKAITELGNVGTPIQFKHRLIDTNPLSTEIGKTGWLKFDQRFFVYKNGIQKNGKINLKRAGVIKSNIVLDSESQETVTSFYQIAGQHLSGGMQLKEHKYVGLNIYGGNAISGMPGYSLRMEYYLSKLFGDVILPGNKAMGATSLKVYYNGAGNNKVYTLDNQENNYHFRRGSIGFSKDFYPTRFLHISPFLGYGLESVKWKGSPNKISSNFTELGVNVGVNITHNVQIIGTYNRIRFIKSILLDEQREVIDENFKYDSHFSDRNKKTGFSIGLRYML